MSLFRGCGVSLVTPFRRGRVDEAALTRLIELQIAVGAEAFIVCDAAGEPYSLTPDERLDVIKHTVERVNGRVPVIAAVYGNHRNALLDAAKSADAIGADGLIIPAPVYQLTSEEGYYLYYEELADSVTTPILMCDVGISPALTPSLSIMEKLLAHDNIVGLQVLNPNLETPIALSARCPDCELYAGREDLLLPLLSIGGCGITSSLANVFPDQIHLLCDAFFRGDLASAIEMHRKVQGIYAACQCEPSPAPMKAMMHMLKLCEADLRCPLLPVSDAHEMLLRETLKSCQLL